MKKIPSQTLYIRTNLREYFAVSEEVEAGFRFPKGRWVLVVEPDVSCCLEALPNVDEAVFAACQVLRVKLEEALVKASRARESYEDVVPAETRKKIEELLSGYNYSLNFKSAAEVVDKALKAFAVKISNVVTK